MYELKTVTGKLKDLFPCLATGTTYRFEITTTNSTATLTLQQEITVGVNINQKVGGLRVKTITSYDGVSTTNNIVKTYNYKVDNTTPAQSSAVLYSKPQYLAIYDPTILVYSAGGVIKPAGYKFHLFTDYSLVPLGSFEGSTVGYSSVKECLSNGACTKYTYFQEIIQDYVGTPVPPTKPRIDAGNLSTKLQINSAGTTVASETNTIYTTDAYASNVNTVTNTADKYFKAINHALVQDGPTVFFLQYDIKNKPYRLSQMVSVLDGVSTTTSYTYDANFIPKRSETVTNSNGATTTSTYYYATHVADANLTNRNMVGFPVKVKQQTGTSIKWSRIRYKLFNTTQIEPEYLEECFDATETTWITRLLISTYSTHGMPTSILKNGFTASETYTWDVTFPKLLKKKQFGNLTSTTSLLKWEVFYKTGTSLVEKTMDADSLIKTYDYDPLMRLMTVKDRMTLTGTDVQATTNYTYQYKDVSNPLNFIKTSTTFAAATNTTPLSTKQFMDGLGRPVSSVRELYTPNSLHQKNNVTYDALGRQDKAYLPFEGATTNYEAAAGTVPSSYTTYEASPLSRPIRQYAEDGKFMETRYGASASGDLQLFSVTTNTDGSYNVNAAGGSAANAYFRTIIYNENWNGSVTDDKIGKTDIFKDKLGRVALTRKYVKDANNVYQNVDTYNLYDDYNNLIMVIPPGAYLTSNAGPTLSLVFQYQYDARQRLIAKKVPNADWVYFYYDARDLLTLTQDGNMRTIASGGNVNKFLGTQYNEIGQVVKTGWVTTTTPVTTALNITIANDTNKLTETQYYPNHTWVKHQGAKVLKKSGVATQRDFIWSYIERRATTGYTGNPAWTGKQHLLSKTYVNGTTLVTADAPITDNDVGGVNWTVSNYDGAQKPLLTINYLFSGPNTSQAQEVRQWQTFNYDNGQRLKSSNYTYALNGLAVTSPTDTLSQINYNVRNQVIEKNTGRKNGKYLQSTDFTYNDRGWLTSINSGFLPSAKDYPLFTSSVAANIVTNYATLATTGFLTPSVNGGENNPDLFKEIIRYDNPNLSYPNNSKTVTPQYNGNISQIEWQVAGREAQAYTFNYDNLERLTESNYTDIHDATWVAKGWASQYESDNKFKESMTYDERGNITTLQRNGRLTEVIPLSGPMVVEGIFNAIDNLTYTYDGTDKNKLLKVADAQSFDKGFKSNSTANAGTTHYAYDTNGNLTRDDNKGITGISYNHLNLPQVITFTNNTSAQPRRIEFIYDATGVKLRKTVFVNNVAIDTTHYVNGIEYKGAVLNRFPHSEGAVVRQGTTATFLHEYTIKDHLGNARVTYTDANANGIVDSSEIKQVNHYYGFGLNMEGNWNGAGGTNKFQYNGKEWNDDFGLGLNDYGARFYDPAIGRWTAVDPLAESMKRHSPYNFCFNNPLKFTDPTGMAPESNANQIAQMVNNAWNATALGTNMSFKVKTKNVEDKETKKEEEQQQPGNNRLLDNEAAATTAGNFVAANVGMDRNTIINQMPVRADGMSGGPRLRYVRDPLNPNGVVIDMRHMLIVGKLGTTIGRIIEWAQDQSESTRASALNPQDYYSNALGEGFNKYLNSLSRGSFSGKSALEGQDYARHLNTFLNSRELRNKYVPRDETYDSVNRR